MSVKYKNLSYINLDGQKPFAEGRHKEAYRVPEAEGKCVLVLKKDTEINLKTILRKLRPKSISNILYRTMWNGHEYTRIHQPELLEHVIPVYGFCKTSKGLGLVTKLITDLDGNVSKTAEARFSELTKEEFKAHIQYLYDKGFKLLDGNLGNILAQKTEDGFKFYIVESYQTSYPPILYFLSKKRAERRSEVTYKGLFEVIV